MTQYQFEAYDPDEQSTITKEFQAVSLDTILQEFQYFLKGAGFEFNGNIEVVPEENYDETLKTLTTGGFDLDMYPDSFYNDLNVEVK